MSEFEAINRGIGGLILYGMGAVVLALVIAAAVWEWRNRGRDKD